MTKRSETGEMARLYRSGMKLREIGDCYGVSRQTVQQRLAALSITKTDRPLEYMLIQKDQLERLYTDQRLSIAKIGELFGASAHTIEQAVKFHKIPKRRKVTADGKYVDQIRNLKIGEAAAIECEAKNPYVILHKSAKRAKAKISLRKTGDKFEVRRIG